MKCSKPYTQGLSAFGCGQCMGCRLNRRRLWSHRMMLEALCHEKSAFVTLTYAAEFLPEGGTLEPKHVQQWLKRFRKLYPVRFFCVGEYGDLSWRPHYHLALYGVDATSLPQIVSTWKMGICHAGDLTMDSASYIAGYVTKKMTRKDDERLDGRYPEFARMSLRPGIGANAIRVIADAIQNKHGWDEISSTGDVPSVLQHGKRKLPLGRYLRSKLREAMNFAETGQQPEVKEVLDQEMRDLWISALRIAKEENRIVLNLSQVISDQSAQAILNMETRQAISDSCKKGGL